VWFARLFAYLVTAAGVPLLVLWWGSWENRSKQLEHRYTPPGWLFLGAVLTAWLSFIWLREGHLRHGVAAFVVSVGAIATALLWAFV
jgi:hypothetical protein